MTSKKMRLPYPTMPVPFALSRETFYGLLTSLTSGSTADGGICVPVLDVFSREIVGVSFSAHHDQELILSGLNDALAHHPPPTYLHTDQGSEYQAYAYFDTLDLHHILASFSDKASPWQNGFQESFYSEFKKDLGDTSRFETVGEFLEGLYSQIYYYNNHRIHTALNGPPALYRQQSNNLSKLS